MSNQTNQSNPERIEKALELLETFECYFPNIFKFNQLRNDVTEAYIRRGMEFGIDEEESAEHLNYHMMFSHFERLLYKPQNS